NRPARLRAHGVPDRVRGPVRGRAGADRGRGDRRGLPHRAGRVLQGGGGRGGPPPGAGGDFEGGGPRRAAPVRDRRDRRDDRTRGDRLMADRRGGRLTIEPQIVRMPRNWGRQTSLFQWRQPAFWLYAA